MKALLCAVASTEPFYSYNRNVGVSAIWLPSLLSLLSAGDPDLTLRCRSQLPGLCQLPLLCLPPNWPQALQARLNYAECAASSFLGPIAFGWPLLPQFAEVARCRRGLRRPLRLCGPLWLAWLRCRRHPLRRTLLPLRRPRMLQPGCLCLLRRFHRQVCTWAKKYQTTTVLADVPVVASLFLTPIHNLQYKPDLLQRQLQGPSGLCPATSACHAEEVEAIPVNGLSLRDLPTGNGLPCIFRS